MKFPIDDGMPRRGSDGPLRIKIKATRTRKKQAKFVAGTCLGELGFWRVKSSKLVQVKHGDCTSILHLRLHALISPSSLHLSV